MITVLINTIAALAILVVGLFSVINAMTRATRHGIRFAWVVITTGALGVLLAPAFGLAQPGGFWTVLLVGFAMFAVLDQRRPGARCRK